MISHEEYVALVTAYVARLGEGTAEVIASFTTSKHTCREYGCVLPQDHTSNGRTCAYHSTPVSSWTTSVWGDHEILTSAKRRFRKGTPKGGKAIARAALGLPPRARPVARYTGPPRRGYVYRLFDVDGRLLYVGKTYSVRARLYGTGGHALTKSWWAEVALVTVTPYRTEADALTAEAWAIKRESPIHNVDRPAPRTSRSPRRIGPTVTGVPISV